MTTESHTIEVAGTTVEVVRKSIKNLHLGVYPPAGRVRVAVPEHVDDEAVRLAVISKLGWIRRQQKAFAEQPRQSEREMVSGESHYVFGRRYRLRLTEEDRQPQVCIQGTQLSLRLRPGTPPEKREEILANWYRRQLRTKLAEYMAHWEPVIGVQAAEWGIKRIENPVGHVQHRGAPHLVQPRARKEVPRVHPVHRRARARAPDRAAPQRPLPRPYGRVHAAVATPPGRPQPRATCP